MAPVPPTDGHAIAATVGVVGDLYIRVSLRMHTYTYRTF